MLYAVLIAGSGLAHPAMAAVQADLSETRFRAFIESLWPEAESRGIPRALFASAFAGLTPDPSLAKLTQKQPEFAKPIGAYLAAQVTAGRIATGQAQRARWKSDLASIEQRFGVPPAIVIAVWGLESNFGASAGNKDVIRSLATLAAMNFRPDLTRAELLAALQLLNAGDISRGDLRGSWAGAMGQPQFMPSSFDLYAVDGDRDGRRDIWGDVPDALASIANFLHTKGFRPDRPWGFEVRLPAGFDLRTSRGTFPEWQARGLTRANGQALPDAGDAVLFFPAGAEGPPFLVTENFEVIKTYNFSDAYVLSVGLLADRIEGDGPVRASWPSEPSMPRENRIALQTRLVALGYTVDNREGRISLALRDAIRLAQVRVGFVPDGNPTNALLEALNKGE